MKNFNQYKQLMRASEIALIHKQEGLIYTDSDLTELFNFNQDEITQYRRTMNEI